MPLQAAYSPNYYSIEDILATQERTTSKFLVPVLKLGKLNPATEEVDLKVGTDLELPLWLAMDLYKGRHPLIAPELPKVYKDSYREILKADPCAVDLYKFGLYFYEVGSYVKRFETRSNLDEILLHTFTIRFRHIMDLADNTSVDPTVVHKLDMLERSLFTPSHDAKTKLSKWLMNSDAKLTAGNMVVNSKKRKRLKEQELF